MLEVKRYRRFDDIPLTPKSWNALVDNSATNTVFLRYDWISKWWEYFGADYQLYFLTVEDDGRVVGFAPLMLDAKGHLRYLSDMSADYLDFVLVTDRRAAVDAILTCLAHYADDWRVLDLKNVPRESGLLDEIIRSSGRIGLHAWHNYSIKAPSLHFGASGVNAKNVIAKKRIRQTMQRLAGKGRLSMRVFSSSVAAAPFWNVFFSQHIERCESQGRKSSFLNADSCEFTKRLMQTDDPRHHAHLSALILDGKPIAFHFGFVSGSRLLLYKPCFDVSLSKFSPGIVLIGHLINYALQHDLDELDFTVGEESYKSRFSNAARDVDTVRVYNSRFRYLRDRHLSKLRQAAKYTIYLIRQRMNAG